MIIFARSYKATREYRCSQCGKTIKVNQKYFRATDFSTQDTARAKATGTKLYCLECGIVDEIPETTEWIEDYFNDSFIERTKREYERERDD